jgi:hypothetical protein
VSALSRFLAGKVGISLTTFEKLALELGLRVVQEAPAETIPSPPSKKVETEVLGGSGATAPRTRRKPPPVGSGVPPRYSSMEGTWKPTLGLERLSVL